MRPMTGRRSISAIERRVRFMIVKVGDSLGETLGNFVGRLAATLAVLTPVIPPSAPASWLSTRYCQTVVTPQC